MKRMSFAIFSGEKDQYVSYLPDIQRKPFLLPLPVPQYLQYVVEKPGTWWLNSHLSKQGFSLFSAEKLSEYLKFQRHPLICAKVFLSFRVLLLKFSPPHLMAFWPAIVAELVSKKLVLSCTLIVPRPSDCKMVSGKVWEHS